MKRVTPVISTFASGAALCLALALAAPTLADDKAPQPAAPEKDLLRGPTVEKPSGSDAPAGMERRRAADGSLPFQAWVRAVNSLQLSADEKSKVDAIFGEYRAATGAFDSEHGARLRELRSAQRDARQSGKPMSQESMQELQKIQSMRPDSAPYQQRIWEMLSDDQKAALTARLEEMRKQLAERATQRRDGMNEDGDPMNPQRGADRPQRVRQPEGARSADPGKAAERRREFLKSRQLNKQPAPPAPVPPPPPGTPPAEPARKPTR